MLQALSNDFLFSIIAFGVILIPAIIIHELGHFLTAKWAGINVLEFGIGFPPRMATLFRWGETDFTMNWLPLGGFVRPLGEDMVGPNVDDETDAVYADEKPKKSVYLSDRDELLARGVAEEDIKSVSDAKPLSRIVFMAGGAAANVLSAIVFFIIAALLGLPEIVAARIQVADFGESTVFAGTSVEADDAIERINGEYFDDYSEFFNTWLSLDDEATLSMRRPETNETYEVTIPAPAVSDVEGFILITAVMENTPAEQSQLVAGDVITGINGEPLAALQPAENLREHTQQAGGSSIEMTILRDGNTMQVTVTPDYNEGADEWRLGIGIMSIFRTDDGVQFRESTPQQELIPKPLPQAITYGFSQTYELLKLIVTLPAQIIDGAISPEEARPVSIVGISQIGGSFIQQSIEAKNPSIVLQFIAMVSIFLGTTNLLPLPALDGGRIVFVIIEMVRGKPVPAHIEGRVHQIGIVLLLALGVVVIIYDIINPLSIP